MPYEKLVGQGRIKAYQARPQEVERLLQVAARDLATAEKVLPENLEQALAFARTFLEEIRLLVTG